MPSEWNPHEPTTTYLPNLFQDMECDLRNEDSFLHHYIGDFDTLLPEDDILESKFCLDNNFIDSLLDDDNKTDKTNMFSQLSHMEEDNFIKEERDIKFPTYLKGGLNGNSDIIKEEKDAMFTSDLMGGLSGSSDSNNSSDTQFTLETPPVSPPIAEHSPRTSDSETIPGAPPALQCNKSAILRINPNNIKIIQNTKGLKPVGRQAHIVLPKDVIQKALKLGSKSLISTPDAVTSVTNGPATFGFNNPAISSSQIGGTSSIVRVLSTHDINSAKSSSQNVNLTHSKPHNILPLLKQEADVVVKNEIQLKALKRQQRMIKNRESACLSRKKKKEYVTSLESKISDLEHANSRLKMENDLLKSRIKELENGFRTNGKVQNYFNSNLRKSTAILAVLLVVSINIGSLSLLSREGYRNNELVVNGGMEITGSDGMIRHGGRSLLWKQPELSQSYTNTSFTSGSTKSYSTCPLFINQTESLRLEKELRQWIAVDEKRGRYKNSTRRGAAPPKKKTTLPQFMLDNANRVKVPHKTQRKTLGAVEIYHQPFPGSLPRRADTFYVFSFSSDHLLIPAVTHNNTLRPKMSFVIPTVPLNDSFINNGTVPMMQIDCEVLATRSIELSGKDFRIFKSREEVVRKGNTSAQVTMRTQPYRPYFTQRRRVRINTEFDDGFETYMNRVYQAATTFP